MLSHELVRQFTALARSPDPDLAIAALLMARIAYPGLEIDPYVAKLDALGQEARRRVSDASPDSISREVPPHVDPHAFARIVALNEFLFDDERFVGNDTQYDDPRNSFLNEVLDRRTGIPITLALVYIEVARRAGIEVEGVNFPGHFLCRHRGARGTRYSRDLIIDAHHGGALLTEGMCRELLSSQGGDDEMWDSRLMAHATKQQILMRMLLNLKRAYVRIFSFQQARDISDLMLAVDPSAITELRDRGLLAYHLNDLPAALRDLENYLRQAGTVELGEDDKDDHEHIWEQVKSLRRRVASFN